MPELGGPQMIEVTLNDRRLRVVGDRPRIAEFWRAAEAGRWEDETFRFLDAVTAESGAVLVDIGAWIGPVSLYAAPRVTRVIALEPDPVAHSELLANTSANASNVEVWNAAVDRNSGELKLYAPDGFGGSETSSIGEGEAVTVRALTMAEIDAAVGQANRVILKVDIEGHEYRILDDLIRFARERKAAVHLSLHPRSYWNDVRKTSGPLAARRATFDATLSAIESLGTVGPVSLSSTGEPFSRGALFRRIFLKRRPKNFSVEVRSPA